MRIAIALLILAVIAAGVSLLVLPGWVKHQVIEGAAAHGVSVTIDYASLTAGGVRLTGMRAGIVDLPWAEAVAPELLVETRNLALARLTVKGAVLTIRGPWSQFEAAITRWAAGARGGGGADRGPTELLVEGARVVWEPALGDDGRVEASGVHLSGAWRADGVEVHVRSDRVTMAVAGGSLGPWRVDVDRVPGNSRVRVALDPGVPEACTLLVVGDDERTTYVDLEVPRSPPARLGLPRERLGLCGRDLQVAASVHYTLLGADHAEATARGGVYGIEAAGLARPLDVTWEGASAGDPRKGMDVRHARLAAGPLVGAVTGTVTTFDDGMRVALAWSGGPAPCSAFDAPLDSARPLDIADHLRTLAEAAGLAKVSGEVSARGDAVFDSRDLGGTRVDFVPTVSCQAPLFAH